MIEESKHDGRPILSDMKTHESYVRPNSIDFQRRHQHGKTGIPSFDYYSMNMSKEGYRAPSWNTEELSGSDV